MNQLLFAALITITSTTAFAGSHKMAPKMKGGMGPQVAFITELVDGKKTWVKVPSDVHFKAGSTVVAKVINLLEASHGFEIKGVVKPMVIAPRSSQIVKFKVKKAGDKKVSCHMHPAHVPTSFSVK